MAILNSTGFRIFALSNGSANTVELLLDNANIRSYFLDIVSVDEIKSYKTNPDVYRHFLTRADALKENSWLISSNPFDVIGAVSYGMRAAWIKRSAEALFDPWGIEPTLTLNGISNLAEQIKSYANCLTPHSSGTPNVAPYVIRQGLLKNSLIPHGYWLAEYILNTLPQTNRQF